MAFPLFLIREAEPIGQIKRNLGDDLHAVDAVLGAVGTSESWLASWKANAPDTKERRSRLDRGKNPETTRRCQPRRRARTRLSWEYGVC